MEMKFCPECGKILKIEREKMVALCSCGFQKIADFEVFSVEKINHPDKGTGIVSGKNEFATFPHKCGKCGHEGAEVIDLGIWYSDESGVILYLCGKCKYVEKEVESNS